MKKCLLFIFLTGLGSSVIHSQEGEKSDRAVFIENKGQWPENVMAKSKVDGANIWMEKNGIRYQLIDFSDLETAHHRERLDHDPALKQHVVLASFVNCSDDIHIQKNHPTQGYYNYFVGNDESKWASDVHGYEEVIYKDLYNGIDMRMHSTSDGNLKYDYILAPHSSPGQIAVQYSGQDRLELKNGNLIIKTGIGEILEQKPYAYQLIEGKKFEIPISFKLINDLLTFELGSYNESYELIIDPVLIFATYSGSVTDNFGMTATYSYDQRPYAGGTVYGNAYPTPNAAYDTSSNFTGPSSASFGISDVYVTKYSQDGSMMLWTTFLGGGDDFDGTETVHSMICDQANSLYLYGATSSTDFPMVNAYQSIHAGGTSGSNFLYNGVYYNTQGSDIYVAKISLTGMDLLGSTYIGGSANDGLNYRLGGGTYNSTASYDSLTVNYGDQFRGEIQLDASNNIYIASSTRSTDFPIVNGFQNTLGGQQDAVIFKLSTDCSTLMWSTYFGGSENDAGFALVLDSLDNVFVTGATSSSDLPGATGGLNPIYAGGKSDGYIGKISPDGSNLIQSTYLGTSTSDQSFFIDTDPQEAIYVVGNTDGSMAISGAAYSNPNSGQFVQKISNDLTSLVFGTVFGSGSGVPDISPSAFRIDPCGNIYVTGWGANILQANPMAGMPLSADALFSTPPNGFDFYMIVIEADANNLIYGSYIGGSQAQEHVDGGTSRYDDNGILYQSVCGGCGGYSDFPVTSGVWSAANFSTNCNNVVFKFDFEANPIASFTADTTVKCGPDTFMLTNTSNDTINYSWNFPPEAVVINGGVSPELWFGTPGTYNITLTVFDPYCSANDSVTHSVTIVEPPVVTTNSDTMVCPSVGLNLVANSLGTADNFEWSLDPGFSTILNAGGMDSVLTIFPTSDTTYYVIVSNNSGYCTAQEQVNITVGCLGIDRLNNVVISIVPNPASESFVLRHEGLDSKDYFIEVYDAGGKRVYLGDKIYGQETTITCSEWERGVYIVTLKDKASELELYKERIVVH